MTEQEDLQQQDSEPTSEDLESERDMMTAPTWLKERE